MSSGTSAMTDMYFGTNPRFGRMGLKCSAQYMAVYMYRKAGQKLAKIKWNEIYRLEVSQEQVVITIKSNSTNIFLKTAGTITFRCQQVDDLIKDLANFKLIKKCDRVIKLVTNRKFYKPNGDSANQENLESLVTDAQFEELDPEKIPLIEL